MINKKKNESYNQIKNNAKEYAFITGAAGGLGSEYARQLADKGYMLILTDKNERELYTLKKSLLQNYHVDIKIITADLSKENDVDNLIKIIKRNNISLLVNNAGFGIHDYFSDTDSTIIENMLRVHNSTPLKLINAAIPKMIYNKKGAIINVSSLSGFFPLPRSATYSASKSFLISFSESLHMELKDKNIKIQVFCPGFVKTSFFENRIGKNIGTKKKRSIFWQSPENAVKKSLKDLKKRNKVICIPEIHNVLLLLLKKIIPRGIYYSLMKNK